MFAHLLGHNGHISEMNALDGKWMSRVTGHLSLREAIKQIDGPRICDAISLARHRRRRAEPACGENGLFGRDEIEVIRAAQLIRGKSVAMEQAA